MSITSTPTGYSNLCTGRLAAKVTTTLATGFTVTADTFKTPAGTGSVTWPTGNQIWKISRKTRTNTEVEYVGVESLSQTGTAITTGAVIRYLSPTDGTSFASVGNGLSFPAGSIVELVWDVRHAEQTAFKNNANSFSDHQTIIVNKELRLADSASAIWDDGTDINFKSSAQATRTLSQLASLSGSNDKVKVSANDTTEDYLLTKLTAGAGITVTETNDGGDEDATIAAVNTVATGHTGLSTITTGAIPIGAGTSNMTLIGPGANAQSPVSNGTTLAMGHVVPVGMLGIWTTDTAPTNWLLCYGQAVSRTTYATLFAVISTAFGVGDGTTTFNLPDLRGRLPLGQDDMGGSSANRITDAAADTIGSTGGTNDGYHTHTVGNNDSASTGSGDLTFHDGNTGSTSVIPPYQTFNYIIFAAA